MIKIDTKEIDLKLGQSGELSENLSEYEVRSGQIKMAKSVLNSFNEQSICVVEAGTGTGKSLAYLLSAALYAISNKETVIVATHTINLQEQLYFKDIPQLKKLKGMESLKVSLLKGRYNYICNRKIYYTNELPELFDSDYSKQMKLIFKWFSSTPLGTRSDIPFVVSEDVWENIVADEDDCSRNKCSYYDQCFYFKSRKMAMGSHLIVVNHHLLLADLNLRYITSDYKKTFVLPPYELLIFDEAHHLEDVATEHLSSNVTYYSISRLLNKLSWNKVSNKNNSYSNSKTTLSLLWQKISKLKLPNDKLQKINTILFEEIDNFVIFLKKELKNTFNEVSANIPWIEEDNNILGNKSIFRIKEAFSSSDLWKNTLHSTLVGFSSNINQLAKMIDSMLKYLENNLTEAFFEKEQQIIQECISSRNKLLSIFEKITLFLKDDPNFVRWFELKKNFDISNPNMSIYMSPIDISKLFYEIVLKPMKTVVLTSATLTTSENFAYISNRIGLSNIDSEDTKDICYEKIQSPFDYKKQVFLGIPKDMPYHTDRDYKNYLTRSIVDSINLLDGGAFVLFTSYSLLNQIFEEISQKQLLPSYPILKQGDDSRQRLLEKFKSSYNGVLFGTDSFWEGVDVQGDALRLVIITRLPFHVPSEPVQEARCEFIDKSGKKAFIEISLPQAILQFKQGFGRLIRHKNDRGVVLVLDSRIIGKSYGRQFLKSINDLPPCIEQWDNLYDKMRIFAEK